MCVAAEFESIWCDDVTSFDLGVEEDRTDTDAMVPCLSTCEKDSLRDSAADLTEVVPSAVH